MSDDQSNRVTGLLVSWEPTAPGPAHHRLAAALRTGVNEGRLRPGDRLPPTRVLADDLGLSRWVVTEAYDQLKAEGYLAARVGSGTVVAGGARRAAVDGPTAGSSPGSGAVGRPDALGRLGSFGSAAVVGSATATATDRALTDLSPALPDLASFPRSLWRAAVTRALAGATDHELGYPDAAGAPALRATVAGYLRRVRGLDVDADRVHVTQGVRNAVSLVCRHLHDHGARRVAVEDPCWPSLREVARGNGLDVVPVPVDDQGMQVDRLQALDDARPGGQPIAAVFVTPTHQFPTGVPLSAPRRRALIEWARRGDRLIVEDDYDAEFRYDRRPVGAMAALAGDHVIYVGSVSKTLSPGLQLGWMVAPARLIAGLDDTRAAIGALAPTLDQLALVQLVESGGYDRHLRRMRRQYQRRRGALREALRDRVPGAAAPSMDAGLHVLWQLPDGTDEAVVLSACRARGLAVIGLSQCTELGGGSPGLVLGYGNLPQRHAVAVADRIADAVTDATVGAAAAPAG